MEANSAWGHRLTLYRWTVFEPLWNNITSLCAKLLQFCPSLCDSVDCSPPGSSDHGILQTRILKWVACPPPGGLPKPGVEPTSLTSLLHWQVSSLPLAPPEKHKITSIQDQMMHDIPKSFSRLITVSLLYKPSSCKLSKVWTSVYMYSHVSHFMCVSGRKYCTFQGTVL